MASNNPAATARRVLSALDANASIGKSVSNISMKPGQVVEKSPLSLPVPNSSVQSPPSKVASSPGGSGLVAGVKRSRSDSIGLEEGDASERASKRLGVQLSEEIDVRTDRSSAATEEDEMVELGNRGQDGLKESIEQGVQTDEQIPTSVVSPTASLTHDVTAIEEDSQNTVSTSFTIADEATQISSTEPQTKSTQTATVASSPRILSKEKIRNRVAAIKLRLGLASYKVRTNQRDVPLQRLQMRTVSSKFPRLPRLPPVSDVPRQPSAAKVPDIQVQKPALQNTSIISTPAYSPEKTAHEASPTTILPRQRDSLLNPPQLESPSGTQSLGKSTPPVGGDAISSVVSEGAVDGLLSLMGARR